MATGDKIRALRIENRMSQEDLGNIIGVQKSAVHKYETGLIVNLKKSVIAKLADALDTTPAYLMGWEDEAQNPTPDRDWGEPLLDAYAEAEKPTQVAACNVLQIPYVDPENHEVEPETEVFRISDQPVAAGAGVYLGPESFHEVYINVNKLPKNAIFGIPIQGNSMEPRFHDGEVVIVTRDEPRIGEIGVFTMEGQGYLKQLGESKLLSLNGDYDPIPMDESIRCNGKVVGVLQEEWVVG